VAANNGSAASIIAMEIFSSVPFGSCGVTDPLTLTLSREGRGNSELGRGPRLAMIRDLRKNIGLFIVYLSGLSGL